LGLAQKYAHQDRNDQSAAMCAGRPKEKNLYTGVPMAYSWFQVCNISLCDQGILIFTPQLNKPLVSPAEGMARGISRYQEDVACEKVMQNLKRMALAWQYRPTMTTVLQLTSCYRGRVAGGENTLRASNISRNRLQLRKVVKGKRDLEDVLHFTLLTFDYSKEQLSKIYEILHARIECQGRCRPY
jgi:hypothetical protein